MIIQELLQKSLTENAERLALFGDNYQKTYQEVKDECNKLAHCIQKRGVKTGDMLAIVLPKCMDYIIVETTCLLYGYGAVLLDSSYPSERVEYCVNDCDAKLPVLMGDTIIKTKDEYLDRELTKEDMPKEVLLGLKEKIDDFVYRASIVNSFGYGDRYALYDGKVVLVDAKLGYSEESENKKLKNARNRYSNLEIIPMEKYSHSDLFKDLSLADFYIKLIEQ